ncbi:hypothetical protein [Methanospirillum hungatei]|uniref:protein kinase domain-containing protein n=1 Tax=Methanospirillum hungatei TaxID=2203 RepID=UPI0026EBEF8B|nr:hypothetical protein [Methanospirillum hungatei]MCA1916108.1 hypothetical protein [Methanospirillum hungatei]
MSSRSFLILLISFVIPFLCITPVCCVDQSSISGITFQGGEYSSDSIPDVMYPGQNGQYMVEFRNTGMTAWEHDVEKIGVEYSGDSNLITIEPSLQLLPKGSRVHTGQSYQFPFLISAHSVGQVKLAFAVVRLLPNGKTNRISDPVLFSMEITPGLPHKDQNTGSIQVTAGPLHVPVELDGMPAGLTPLTLPDIPVGMHHVVMKGKEGVMERDIEVKPNTIHTITYSPEKSGVLIETKESLLLENSNPILTLILSNFFIILGVIIALTVVAVISIVVISGEIKKIKFVVSQVLPSSVQKESGRDFAIETRRRTTSDDVRFDPVPGLFKQGDKKSLKLKITNLGTKPIVVDTIRIDPGECRIVFREISDDDPGDCEVSQQVSYIDGNGTEKSRVIHLRYRIMPRDIDLSWFFERFIQKNGKIIAILKIKNNNPFPLEADSVLLASGEERGIEFLMDIPDSDELSVFKKLHILTENEYSFPLSVKIPYNKGIFLFFSKKYSESLEWFNQQIDLGNDDGTLKRYRDLIKRKMDSSSEANTMDSSDIRDHEPDVKRKVDAQAGNATQVSLSPSLTGFPDSLLPIYKPSALISTDRLGIMYRALRAADNIEVAVRVLDSGIIPASQVELQIQAWRSLKHMNIMQIKFWERDPVYFLEFDLPSGAIQSKKRIYSLADLKVPIPARAALRIVRGLAEGIDYIHRQGVRHYLLEPSVIFLDDKLQPKISGFDTSALIQSGIPDDCWVIAPEQRNPEKFGNPGKKTDIYQVGAIFYYLLSGQVLTCNESISSLPSHFRSDYRVYDSIIEKSVHIDKNERYGDIREMVHEIDILLRTIKK